MNKGIKIALGAVAVLALLASWPAYQLYAEISKAISEDPLVWEEDIAALEKNTAGKFEPGEGVVFVGSSSIRLWSTLERDMAPIPVIQHGFGGAKINDVVHYADRLITHYQPRAVVIFVATNDITPEAAKTPQALLEAYQTLIASIRRDDPALPVYYIAITPSILRWAVWDVAQATNELIAQWSATQRNLYVIDTGDALLNAQGEPDEANYVIDGLHLSEAGYQIWTRLIKPPLMTELNLSAAD